MVTAFARAYDAAYQANASTFAGYAYDGLHLALAAVARAGGTDKGKVRDEIEKTRDFVGTTGIFTMSPTDHMGLSAASFHMTAIHGGSWVLLD